MYCNIMAELQKKACNISIVDRQWQTYLTPTYIHSELQGWCDLEHHLVPSWVSHCYICTTEEDNDGDKEDEKDKPITMLLAQFLQTQRCRTSGFI